MKGQFTTDTGSITIDTDVIAKYAGFAAVDCFGIVGMAVVSMKDGWAKLLKRRILPKALMFLWKMMNYFLIFMSLFLMV